MHTVRFTGGAPRLISAVVWGAQNSSTYFVYHKLRQSRLTIYTYVIAPGYISLPFLLPTALTSACNCPFYQLAVVFDQLEIVLWSAWKSSFDLLESVFCSARNRLSICLNHNVGKCSLNVIPRIVIPWWWIPLIQQSRIPVSASDYRISVRFDQILSNLEYMFNLSTST